MFLQKTLEGTATSRHLLLMGSKVPMVPRGKEKVVMDNKAPTADKVVVVEAAVAAMEDGVKVQISGFVVNIPASCKTNILKFRCSQRLSLHQVKVVVRVGGMDVTKETAQKEGASEAEAAVATTVAVMTAVVDMIAVASTVAEEEDLLVWGKLHSATAPKVPLYTVKYET